MTIRWIASTGFDLGIGFHWGDSRHRSIVWAIHLGPRSLIGVIRWWL